MNGVLWGSILVLRCWNRLSGEVVVAPSMECSKQGSEVLGKTIYYLI